MRHIVFVFALSGAACQTNAGDVAAPAPAQSAAQVPAAPALPLTRAPKGALNDAGLLPHHIHIVERAYALDATLTSPEDAPTEGIAAEGGGVRVWRHDGVVQKVVLEKRGETFDSVTTLNFEYGRSFYARRFVVLDPAKFAEEGTPEYVEAANSRALEVAHYFWTGDEIDVMTARLDGAKPATYDAGALVETLVGPVVSAPKDTDLGVQLREAIAQDLNAIEPIVKPKEQS